MNKETARRLKSLVDQILWCRREPKIEEDEKKAVSALLAFVDGYTTAILDDK